MHMLPRRRWHERRGARLGLGAVVLTCLTVVGVLARPGPASTQIPSIPWSSSAQLFVAGNGGSAMQPFATDSIGAPATTTATPFEAVADTTNGQLTVAISQLTSTATSTATVMNSSTGQSVASFAVSGFPEAVASDPDPAHANTVLIVTNDAVYSADLTNAPSVTTDQLFSAPMIPPTTTLTGTADSFDTIALSPDGSTAYVGGSNCTIPAIATSSSTTTTTGTTTTTTVAATTTTGGIELFSVERPPTIPQGIVDAAPRSGPDELRLQLPIL